MQGVRTIHDIRVARAAAERAIVAAIREFEQYSDLSVSAVKLTYSESVGERQKEVISVYLDVRLD